MRLREASRSMVAEAKDAAPFLNSEAYGSQMSGMCVSVIEARCAPSSVASRTGGTDSRRLIGVETFRRPSPYISDDLRVSRAS